MKWTVIAVHENGQTFADTFDGEDAFDAMRSAARTFARFHEASLVEIIGAVEGDHSLVAPCEESGKVASAADLLD